MGPDGLIVTAYHVIQDATAVTIRDSSFETLPNVIVQYIDPIHDIAILKSSRRDLPGLTPTTDSQVAQTGILVRGSPRGTPKQVFSGQITSEGVIHSTSLADSRGKQIFAKDINIYTIDITIYSGMSGAPVLTSAGNVIGVLSGSYDEVRGIGWAIPIAYALDLLNSAPKGVPAASIGVWPALDLMGPSWLSYKRSYGKKFDSAHIGQLEILETALPKLRGKWTASNQSRKSDYGCDLSEDNIPIVTFESVDEDGAAITGKFEATYITTVAPRSNDSDTTSAERQEKCNRLAFRDESVSEQTTHVAGTVSLKALHVDRPSNKFGVHIYISDCTGPSCTALVYGDRPQDDLEVISDTKLREGDLIWAKSE
jgi:S1-C subfamily serine protease